APAWPSPRTSPGPAGRSSGTPPAAAPPGGARARAADRDQPRAGRGGGQWPWMVSGTVAVPEYTIHPPPSPRDAGAVGPPRPRRGGARSPPGLPVVPQPGCSLGPDSFIPDTPWPPDLGTDVRPPSPAAPDSSRLPRGAPH